MTKNLLHRSSWIWLPKEPWDERIPNKNADVLWRACSGASDAALGTVDGVQLPVWLGAVLCSGEIAQRQKDFSQCEVWGQWGEWSQILHEFMLIYHSVMLSGNAFLWYNAIYLLSVCADNVKWAACYVVVDYLILMQKSNFRLTYFLPLISQMVTVRRRLHGDDVTAASAGTHGSQTDPVFQSEAFDSIYMCCVACQSPTPSTQMLFTCDL